MPERENAPIEEEELEQPKKGGGKKLFVLLLLVMVLGGGGFFAMKMKLGKGRAAKVELGEIVPLPEILVNLRDPNTYARTEISLHFKKGFEKTKFDERVDAVRDAVILKLSSKSLKEVQTLEGKLTLKREIAKAVNRVLGDSSKTAPEVAAKDSEWESDTGPVLKIYFANFATQ